MIVAAIAVIVTQLAAGTSAAADSAPADTQPIAIPVDPVDCAGAPVGGEYAVGAEVIIPIGKACPAAAVWLRWDEEHGAQAGHDAFDPVTWILQPNTPDLRIPSWQRVLPGRSESRLRDLEAALNTWDGMIIKLPLVGAARGDGDGREVEVVAVVPFRLEHAYLARADGACGSDGDETCLVGAFVALPSPSPSGTPGPTTSPTPSGTVEPTPISSSSPTPSPSSSPSPTPTPSVSPSTVPTPSPTLPPDAYIEISVPEHITIPLIRDVANGVDVPVAVRSNVSWTLLVADLEAGPTRGHMVPMTGNPAPLAAAMTAFVAPGPPTPLDDVAPIRLTTGSGNSSFVVAVGQLVGPSDAPGTYAIRLMFRAISAF